MGIDRSPFTKPGCVSLIAGVLAVVVASAAGIADAAPSSTPRLASGHSYYFTNKTNGGRLWWNQNTGAYQTKTVASGHYTILYVTPSGIDQELQDGAGGLACMQYNASGSDVVNSGIKQCTGSITADPPSVVWGAAAGGGGYYFLQNVYTDENNTCPAGEQLELSSLGM